MNSGRWRDVDRSDPDFFVGYLDQAANILREPRSEVMRALDVQPGQSVLDIGSGVGEFLIELASAVPGIRAVGIDPSDALLAAASARAAAAEVVVEFTCGDAEHLDFADRSFDRVNCSRVLVHLEDPQAAVTEMARVLAPGGRVAIWEPDFDALMIDSDDLAIASAVRAALCAGLRNPDIGRRLRRLVLGAGLDLVDVLGSAILIPSLQHALDQFHLLEHLETAVAARAVKIADGVRWRAGIEADAASGRFNGHSRCIPGHRRQTSLRTRGRRARTADPRSSA